MRRTLFLAALTFTLTVVSALAGKTYIYNLPSETNNYILPGTLWNDGGIIEVTL